MENFKPNTTEIITARQISVELSDTEFHENAFSCSRQTDRDTNRPANSTGPR